MRLLVFIQDQQLECFGHYGDEGDVVGQTARHEVNEKLSETMKHLPGTLALAFPTTLNVRIISAQRPRFHSFHAHPCRRESRIQQLRVS